MKALVYFAVFGLFVAGAVQRQDASSIEEASVCDLLSNPAHWNHKLVKVTGFASHGFEDSTFQDPACTQRTSGLWMEFGGLRLSGTKSTVSDGSIHRTKPATVEGIQIPLVDDAVFHRFDRFLRSEPYTMVHATVIGRFFAGKTDANGLSNFGHLGCCSLLMVQQVVDVDDVRRTDLDYGRPPGHLEATCTQFASKFGGDYQNDIHDQSLADSGVRAFAFQDTERVAREGVAEVTQGVDVSGLRLVKRSSDSCRLVYDAVDPLSKRRFVVTLTRPYWLSYFAKDKTRVVWTVIGFEADCLPDKK